MSPILFFILIGLAAGWLAGRIMKTGSGSALTNLVVGVIGALLGGYLFDLLGIFPGGGLIGSLITATVGAVVLIAGLRVINR